MDFKPNITSVDVIKNQKFNQRFKKVHLRHILETFILIDKFVEILIFYFFLLSILNNYQI